MRKFTKEHNGLNWLFPPMSENDNECGESIFDSTDKLLKELPTYIYNDRGDAEWFQLLHCSDNEWLASYGVLGEFLCMNPTDEEGPYDNAFAYGDTPNEALSELYQWCKEHNFV